MPIDLRAYITLRFIRVWPRPRITPQQDWSYASMEESNSRTDGIPEEGTYL